MDAQYIVSWLMDKADRAPDPSWPRMMKAAADKLVRYAALLNDNRNCMTCEYSRDTDTRCMCEDSQWAGCQVNKDIYCGKYVKRQTERNYVIVANKHSTWPSGALLFWGRYTEDGEERSFGSYTTRFDMCEKYTREELLRWRNGDSKHYPFFDELGISGPGDFHEHDEVLCTLEDLETIGYTVWQTVCRY